MFGSRKEMKAANFLILHHKPIYFSFDMKVEHIYWQWINARKLKTRKRWEDRDRIRKIGQNQIEAAISQGK